MNVLTFGEVLLRLAAPGHTTLGQSLPGTLEAVFGGAEANVAAALVRLGATASLLSAVPDGPVGDACLAALAARGIDLSRVVRGPGRLGLYFLEPGVALRPGRVVYDRAGSLFADTGADGWDLPGCLEGAEWLHFTGINPALSAPAAAATAAVVEGAAAAGVPISVDLNYRDRLWRWDPVSKPEALARRVMPDLVRHATVVIGNEEDAARVLGLPVAGLDLDRGQLDPAAYADLARRTAAACPAARWVAFSLRRSVDASRNLWGGVLLDVTADRIYFHPDDGQGGLAPLAIDPVVDRVGGGDSFAAGLIYGLGHARTLPAETLATAVAAGALAQTTPGDALEADREQVLALARGATSGRIKR